MVEPLPDGARTAFLFQCGNGPWFAVSHDKTGANIPTAECSEGWQLRTRFALGVQEAMPVAIEPEPILRGIDANGYFVWRMGSIFGTSQ